MKGLTKRQREIVTYIQQYIDLHAYSPSYREIKQEFQFSSLGSVYKHIQLLKRKGILLNEKQSSRSLALAQTSPTKEKENSLEIELPFIGYVSEGAPVELFAQALKIAVPRLFVPSIESTYVLRARGNSLAAEKIADGDFLIVEARHDAFSGETILASVHKQKTFIKKYYPEGDRVRLEGHMATSQPLLLRKEDMVIQGVITGLLRLF